MPELNYEMKNLDSMWTRIAATTKIEIVCAVLEDEIIALKKQEISEDHSTSSIESNNLSDLITILENRIEELKPYFHSHTRPFNSTPKA
jgi:DNA repair exonuclease SbcCD ATPase subunit